MTVRKKTWNGKRSKSSRSGKNATYYLFCARYERDQGGYTILRCNTMRDRIEVQLMERSKAYVGSCVWIRMITMMMLLMSGLFFQRCTCRVSVIVASCGTLRKYLQQLFWYLWDTKEKLFYFHPFFFLDHCLSMPLISVCFGIVGDCLPPEPSFAPC